MPTVRSCEWQSQVAHLCPRPLGTSVLSSHFLEVARDGQREIGILTPQAKAWSSEAGGAGQGWTAGPPCTQRCCLACCPVREERRPWLAALPHPDSRDGNTSEPWHDAAGARDTQVAHLRALERVRTTKNWCSVGKKWKESQHACPH